MSVRRLLVLCDGNTCRSPTLMLLLRYQARLFDVAHRVNIDSAGIGMGASRSYRMLSVAQEAAERAALWLASQLGILAPDASFATTLRTEASNYKSKIIPDPGQIDRVSVVICLLRKNQIPHSSLGRKLLSSTSVRWHPIGDNAFREYVRHGKIERHPAVVAAYDRQAQRLARLITEELCDVVIGKTHE
jgi:Low molecular weight phosphotyrosine protein phosphatase